MNPFQIMRCRCLVLVLLWAAVAPCIAADPVALRQVLPATEPPHATLRIHANQRSPFSVSRLLTGKFAEHLHDNVVNGMDAQILRNPTFADYPLAIGEQDPDGNLKVVVSEPEIGRRLRDLARNYGWPAAELDAMVSSRADGLASLWSRLGPRSEVQVSPDTAPFGGRAQRVQVTAAGQGLSQWTYLPLHRTREYVLEVFARSPDLDGLTVSLSPAGTDKPCASTTLTGLSTQWHKLSGALELEGELPAGDAYKFTLAASAKGQFVVRHVLLRPADHVNGADPDVIRFLKDSRLPLLRWPGGNFVSAYHWEDGVGPVEARPTRPNYAWGGAEPNLFGTDEFIAFCRAVGCEPMICVNAGSGTPEEAVRWLEYCNGPATSPQGMRRARNGHPEPYGVKYWEVGNELWGRWQFHWTTASGYVDRFRQFAPALAKADPTVELQACGAPVFWGKQWNDTLLDGLGSSFRVITDHPLIGGAVSPSADPLDVFRDFMAVPEVLEQKWAALRQDMLRVGIEKPQLAVTELQLFPSIGRNHETNAPLRLTHENLVRPHTLAEGLYDVLIYHAAVRLAPFVEMVTHSATVNHGGGLRKVHERVFANPCYYAQSLFSAFADSTPVAVELESAVENAPMVLPELRNATTGATYSAVDAMAALATDGSLLLSLVHRSTTDPLHLTISIDDFRPASPTAELQTLAGPVPWAVNTPEQPEAIIPVKSSVPIKAGKIEIDLRPYSVLRLRLPAK